LLMPGKWELALQVSSPNSRHTSLAMHRGRNEIATTATIPSVVKILCISRVVALWLAQFPKYGLENFA